MKATLETTKDHCGRFRTFGTDGPAYEILQTGGGEAVRSVYVTEIDDLANLFGALLALKALPWFPQVVRDIRGFRIENWSDFTALMKG